MTSSNKNANGEPAASENFLLPQTEAAVVSIITELTRFFDAARIGLQAVFTAYLAMRLFLLPRFFVFNIILLALNAVQLVFVILDYAERLKLSECWQNALRFSKRFVSLFMLIFFYIDTFVLTKEIGHWQVVSLLLMAVGCLLALAGDIFALTVPRYAQMILSGFKADIEVSSLASRSITKVKEAAKDAMNSPSAKKATVAVAGGAVALAGLKLLSGFFGRRNGGNAK